MRTKNTSNSLWNWKDIFIVQSIAVLTRGLTYAFQNFLIPENHFLGPFFMTLTHYLGHVALGILLLFWTFHLYGISFSYFGLTFKNFKEGFFMSIKIALPLLFLVILLINYPLTKGNDCELFTPLLYINGIESLAVSLVYFLLLSILFLLPSFAIELLYRGFVGTYMANKVGRVFGGVLNALYFSLFFSPLNLVWFIFYMALGIILYHSFLSRQNLWLGIFYLSFTQAIVVLYVFGFHFFTY